ncbi:hypothetical protein HOA91_00455 [Candidatus Woesearchaeota archaeon]|nr:hypothetical protein [Candidatus Woesearchaeota archaeon]
MKQSSIKKFVLDYLESNEIKFSIDKNNIHTVYFKEVLANKLGIERKFTFNREISDDHGVDYLSIHSDLTKFLLRDSLDKGQIVKAVLDFPVKIKDKLNLPETIKIKKQEEKKEIAICFMFKVSSTNTHENQPEFLKFVIVDYENGTVFPEEISSEFHNFDFKEARFKFNPNNVVKSHSVAYETLEKYLNNKYEESGIVNKALLNKQIEEMESRHDEFKRECKMEVSKQEDRCKYWRERIKASRTIPKEREYRNSLKASEEKLEQFKKENESKTNLNFLNTESRIKDIKNQYDFDINVYLSGSIVFEYNVKKLILQETQSGEEVSLTYNVLSNSIQEYVCPTCEKTPNSFNISINGYFCCPSCSTYQEKDKGFLCKRDNVEKCIITGNFIKKEVNNQCLTCKKYFDKSLFKKDVLGKRTCPLCLIKTYFGDIINKKDAIFSKKHNAYFKPDEVTKCIFSNEYYLLNEVSKTTGSRKTVANKYIEKCKFTGLTFVKNEMSDEGTSKLVTGLKEIDTKNIKYSHLKEVIKKNRVEFNENSFWALARVKGLLKSKYFLYDKKKKEILSK